MKYKPTNRFELELEPELERIIFELEQVVIAPELVIIGVVHIVVVEQRQQFVLKQNLKSFIVDMFLISNKSYNSRGHGAAPEFGSTEIN